MEDEEIDQGNKKVTEVGKNIYSSDPQKGHGLTSTQNTHIGLVHSGTEIWSFVSLLDNFWQLLHQQLVPKCCGTSLQGCENFRASMGVSCYTFLSILCQEEACCFCPIPGPLFSSATGRRQTRRKSRVITVGHPALLYSRGIAQ